MIDGANSSEYAFFGPKGGLMARLRAFSCVVVSLCFVVTTAMGTSAPAVGTITSALGAHIGSAAATTGATVFGGDRLETQQTGTLQVRTGAARLMLSASSVVTMSGSAEAPGAELQRGTAVFSTANANSFVLHASTAAIRPETDAPTVVQVTYVTSKELIVRTTRGSITITVDGETKAIPEAMAYRVILDPDSYMEASAAPGQGPRGAGAPGRGGPPRKAGRSRFLLLAIIVTGVVTAIALDEVLESPSKP